MKFFHFLDRAVKKWKVGHSDFGTADGLLGISKGVGFGLGRTVNERSHELALLIHKRVLFP